MSHFGPYTPQGMTFDFTFHGVASISVSPAKVHIRGEGDDFCTRRITLTDAEGLDVVITCFSDDNVTMPAKVELGE